MTLEKLPAVLEPLIEPTCRKVADVVLDDLFEGDAASEWRRLEPAIRLGIISFLNVALEAGVARYADAFYYPGDGSMGANEIPETAKPTDFAALIIRTGDT